MNKLRLILAGIFAFGWLLSTPTQAYPDDALTIAAQEISQLNSKIENLIYKEKMRTLIDIAENKFTYAKNAMESRDAAFNAYDDSVEARQITIDAQTLAQSNVDGQTVTVNLALTHKNNAQEALDIANINLSNTPVPTNGIQGVAFRIYPLSRSGNMAVLDPNAGLMCHGSIPTFYAYAGWGAICGLHENIIGIFNATLTVPEEINSVKFAGATDDGFRLYIDNVLETSQWQEQGTEWSPYTRWIDTSVNKTLNLEVWWYNGGGPGNMVLGWGYNNIWTGIPNAYLSYGQASSQQVIDAYDNALAEQASAQGVYEDKLAVYNLENQILTSLQQNLTMANQNLTTAEENLTTALSTKNNSVETYNQSLIDLNNAIDDAWKYYYEQGERELLAALALAAANQPKPEPSPEPSQSPSEPDTEPIKPTPLPEATPSPEPSTEPSEGVTEPSEPTPTPTPSPDTSEKPQEPDTDTQDPDPIPTTSPTPSPSTDPSEGVTEPSDKPGQTEDLSGMIANLTSKDNILALTPEQKSVLANTLGIKTEEVQLLAQIAQENTNVAEALSTFENRAAENTESTMPYTLADAVTEVQTEALLEDPIAFLTDINFEELSSPSEWGKDMTDDQREKAQEVIVPVIIASNIVAAAMTRRK